MHFLSLFFSFLWLYIFFLLLFVDLLLLFLQYATLVLFFSIFLAIVSNCICIDVFVDLLLMLINLPIVVYEIKQLET